MTQIINVTLDHHVIHVSDRRLSRRGPAGGFTSFDRNSNKLVVVLARDGLAAVAYTGIAYLDGQPTDRVLAEVASGRSLGSGAFITSLGQGEPIADIGMISLRIVDRLNAAWSRLPTSEQALPFEVLISGWKRRGPLNVPFHWAITKTSTAVGWNFKVNRFKRLWPSLDGFALSAAPDIETAVFEGMRKKLRDVSAPRVERTCEVLNDVIRAIADLRPGTVGKSYMRAILCPWEAPQLRLRLEVSAEDADMDIPHKGFSPWIVLRSGVWAPSEMFARDGHSGWTCMSTGFSWSVEEVTNSGKSTFMQRPQKRPLEPKR